jgi:hypothetical protein
MIDANLPMVDEQAAGMRESLPHRARERIPTVCQWRSCNDGEKITAGAFFLIAARINCWHCPFKSKVFGAVAQVLQRIDKCARGDRV